MSDPKPLMVKIPSIIVARGDVKLFSNEAAAKEAKLMQLATTSKLVTGLPRARLQKGSRQHASNATIWTLHSLTTTQLLRRLQKTFVSPPTSVKLVEIHNDLAFGGVMVSFNVCFAWRKKSLPIYNLVLVLR